MRCVNKHQSEFWHFYLKDAVSDEQQAREFSWERKKKHVSKTNTESKMKVKKKHTHTTKTTYLFVLLIFLISQQGFCALLHPEGTKSNHIKLTKVSQTLNDSRTLARS